MKFHITQIIEVDLEAERKRLRENLTGKQLERHLHLVDLFEREQWEAFDHAYSSLPRDEDGEFPEQELVGNYVGIVWGLLFPRGSIKDFTDVVTTHQKQFKVIKEKDE